MIKYNIHFQNQAIMYISKHNGYHQQLLTRYRVKQNLGIEMAAYLKMHLPAHSYPVIVL